MSDARHRTVTLDRDTDDERHISRPARPEHQGAPNQQQRLKTVAFDMDGRKYEAIEQNPHKPSQWGKLASSGHQVVQFKDVQSNKFVAVSVDGKVKEYGIQSRQKKSAS